MTNVVNPVLEKIRFWPRLESLIAKISNVTPRVDTSVRHQGPEPSWLTEYRTQAARATS